MRGVVFNLRGLEGSWLSVISHGCIISNGRSVLCNFHAKCNWGKVVTTPMLLCGWKWRHTFCHWFFSYVFDPLSNCALHLLTSGASFLLLLLSLARTFLLESIIDRIDDTELKQQLMHIPWPVCSCIVPQISLKAKSEHQTSNLTIHLLQRAWV